LLLAAALGGCAHLAAPVGWDCRASVEESGIQAVGWLNLSPSGQVRHRNVEWSKTGPRLMERVRTSWDFGSGSVDWNSGKVDVAVNMIGISPQQTYRLELRAGDQTMSVGPFNRGSLMFLRVPLRQVRSAAAARPLSVVVIAEPGSEIARFPFSTAHVERGLQLSRLALSQAEAKAADHERQCEKAPEIIVT
jgi:hypothetical protein